MTDKHPDNFIVKFFGNECAIDIEIFEISNYFSHLEIMSNILLLCKLFINSMDINIKYNGKKYITKNTTDLIEFLYDFIKSNIPKLSKNL